jgi:hypothetical protein
MSKACRTITAILVLSVVASLAAVSYAWTDTPPPAADVQFAQKVSDLFVAEVFAALLQEFSETTPDNVEHGKQAISLVFDDLNRNMRLIGEFGPLLGGDNDLPTRGFERQALDLALTGQNSTALEKVNGTWYYRRSIALSNFHPSCVMCHANFGPTNPAQWVGALALSVPIATKKE